MVVAFDTSLGILNTGGGGYQQLVAANTYGVRVSPNGLYVARDADAKNLALYNLESGAALTRAELKDNTTNSYDAPFRWFPDGNRLLATDDEGNWVVGYRVHPSSSADR